MTAQFPWAPLSWVLCSGSLPPAVPGVARGWGLLCFHTHAAHSSVQTRASAPCWLLAGGPPNPLPGGLSRWQLASSTPAGGWGGRWKLPPYRTHSGKGSPLSCCVLLHSSTKSPGSLSCGHRQLGSQMLRSAQGHLPAQGRNWDPAPDAPSMGTPALGRPASMALLPGLSLSGSWEKRGWRLLALWLRRHVLHQTVLGDCQWNKIRPQVTVPRNINSSMVGKCNILYINKSSMSVLVHAEKPFDKIKYPLLI